jgi:hypothetical protein
MPKNSSALFKLNRFFFLVAAFFAFVNFLYAQDSEIRWYRSNSSGMTLELIPSRLAALRNEYCLSIRSAVFREIPEMLLPYYNDSYRIELRVLYKEGEENRRQWIFREGNGLTRIIAAGSGRIFNKENSGDPHRRFPSAEENGSGLIEIRNSDGDVIRELQFDEDLSEWEYRYFYRGSTLLRAEIWFKESPLPPVMEVELSLEEDEDEEVKALPPVVLQPIERPVPVFVRMFTDVYRYTRAGSIRAIDRTIHEAAARRLRVGFPRLGPGVSSGEELVSQGSAYTSEYFMGVQSPDGITITYNLDTRGRILGEIWKDEKGIIIGELINIWSGDRLQSVAWKSDDDERLIEYEYDRDGSRIVERNFRRGVLERSIAHEDGIDIEDIYMNGRLILRARWENGVKTSEERVFPGRGAPR